MMGARCGKKVAQVVPAKVPEDASELPDFGLTQSYADATEDPRLRDGVAVFLACGAPCALLLLGCSLLGYGMEVYTAVAPRNMDKVGSIFVFATAVCMCGIFVFDIPDPDRWLRRVLVEFVSICLGIAAAVLKGIRYPWAAVLFAVFLMPLFLVEVRRSVCRRVKRKGFYWLICVNALVLSACQIALWVSWMFLSSYTPNGAMWTEQTKAQLRRDSRQIYANVYEERALNWASDCSPEAVAPTDPVVAGLIETACASAETVWFVVWMSPLIGILFTFFLSIFCFLQTWFDLTALPDCTEQESVTEDQLARETSAQVREQDRLTKAAVDMVKYYVILVVTMMMGVYIAIYIGGASVHLASAFMAFFAGAMMAIVVYLIHEVKQVSLERAAEYSAFVKNLKKAYTSDWMRAIGIGSMNVLIPIFLGLDTLRQRARVLRMPQKTPQEKEDKEAERKKWFTSTGERLCRELSAWSWCSILTKVNILGELFLILTLGGKLTFILFSWLNTALEPVDFGIVLVLVFVVGIVMFMLPPVPGSAVYVFYGIVIGKQAQSTIGFWPGVALACVIGLAAKLVACVGQYAIGALAGKNVQVQKTIGVDTVPTRAIEKILSERGWKLGKVAILVGGPDWPTSVTCGVLRLNIPQMLLGTLPVFLSSIIPQTLVGALLTMETGSDANFWNMVKTGATAVAGLGQAVASGVAAYAITQTIELDHEELSRPRAEHEAVALLTERQKAYNDKVAEITKWSVMPSHWRALILLSAAMQLMGGFVIAADFVLFEPICFRKFQITSRIDDAFLDGGLNGNVLNIVLPPVGVITLVVMCIATALHLAHGKIVGRTAMQRLKS